MGVVALDHAQWQRPDLIVAQMDPLAHVCIAVYAAVKTILPTLSRLLEILLATPKLEDSHRTSGERSPEATRLLRYYAFTMTETRTTQIPHIDLGSLIFLCTKQYGSARQKLEMGSTTAFRPCDCECWGWPEDVDGMTS